MVTGNILQFYIIFCKDGLTFLSNYSSRYKFKATFLNKLYFSSPILMKKRFV